MIYYRCKCGKHESWSSMGQPPCRGCNDCKTTLAAGPSSHVTPKPHVIGRTRVEADEGEAFRSDCLYCHDSLKKIEARGEPWLWEGGSKEAATR